MNNYDHDLEAGKFDAVELNAGTLLRKIREQFGSLDNEAGGFLEQGGQWFSMKAITGIIAEAAKEAAKP